jgi:hypothetical protein
MDGKLIGIMDAQQSGCKSGIMKIEFRGFDQPFFVFYKLSIRFTICKQSVPGTPGRCYLRLNRYNLYENDDGVPCPTDLPLFVKQAIIKVVK